MSFIAYDLTFLAIFTLAVVIFLIRKRKNLKREGVMYLYKTKIGLKAIDFLGKRYPKTLRVLSFFSVALGYVLMIFTVYLMISLFSLFTKPEFVKIVKIPPIMPIIPYLPELFQISWLPPFYVTYWLISLAIVALVHEGSHGIFAKFYDVKIKSTGFGFLGPFLAFFVEQDDKQMTKKKIFPQLTILSAGVFANILISILFVILMAGFIALSYAPAGAIFNGYEYNIGNITHLDNSLVTNQTLKLDGLNLTQVYYSNRSYYVFSSYLSLNSSQRAYYEAQNEPINFYQDLPAIRQGMRGVLIQINDKEIKNFEDLELIKNYSIGEEITVKTREIGKNKTINTYTLILAKSYENNSTPTIGTLTIRYRYNSALGKFIASITNLFKNPYTYYEPKYNEELVIFIYNLFWWIIIINLSVALSNMLPAFIFDGGRFWYLTVLAITRKEEIATRVFKLFTWLLLLFFLALMFLWAKAMFIK